MSLPAITLTTDFGTRDPYVAAMKGVLTARAPGANILDLSHEIGAHDLVEAALFVAAAVPYFPAGTIHVVVIDPGVGTARRGLAARVAEQYLVAPDNGVLSLLFDQHPPAEVRETTRWEPPGEDVAPTFHGRDVFAPVAAALASGTSIVDIGPPVTDPVRLELPAPGWSDGRWAARVIHVDRFGNAVTNLHRASVDPAAIIEVRAGGRALGRVARTYGDVAPGEPVVLFGSAGYLEVAVNQGRADRELGIGRGSEVEVMLRDD